MRARHPVPRLWLMTDERQGASLWAAVRRLPRGAGIVFRHHATPPVERRRLFARLLRMARVRGLTLVRAGATPLPGEMGVHGGRRPLTAPAHDRREAVAALRREARALFVSPVFATRSHPGVDGLGRRGARRIAQGMPVVRIALGGMEARRYRALAGFDGWAAIDAWSGQGAAAKPRRRSSL